MPPRAGHDERDAHDGQDERHVIPTPEKPSRDDYEHEDTDVARPADPAIVARPGDMFPEADAS